MGEDGWMSYSLVKLKDISHIKTGKLNSNAAVLNGEYPFFTCDPNTLRINTWAYDTEAVLLAGNNASGNYTAKYYKGKFNAYQRVYIIEVANNEQINARYLCYALNQQLQFLKQISTGSTTKFLTLGMLLGLTIPLPAPEKQKNIVAILAAYDNLIENNQKQIKLLEEAAQRLYKEWFVDLRFPGYENTKIVDGVPEGWKDKIVADLCDTIGGGTPSTKVEEYYRNGTIRWVTPTDITRKNGLVLLDSEKRITQEGLQHSSAKIVPPYAILMTSRASVGFFGLCAHEVCTNQGFISCIPYKEKYRFYLLYNLMNRVEEIRGKASGSTFLEIGKKNFRELHVLLPTDSVLDDFTNRIQPTFQKIELLTKSIAILQEARDRLLHKLMNGELEV